MVDDLQEARLHDPSAAALPFTKDDYATMLGLGGKIDALAANVAGRFDLLAAKFDGLSQGLQQQIESLRTRDDAQAEKMDAVAMRLMALEQARAYSRGEANVLARAWGVGSALIVGAVQAAAYYLTRQGH